MSSLENPISSGVNTRFTKLQMPGEETPDRIKVKFCGVVDIHNIVTYTHFIDDCLRVVGMVRSHISGFPLAFAVILRYCVNVSLAVLLL